jgi:hypothetical protein
MCEITPYKWVHLDEDRQSGAGFGCRGSAVLRRGCGRVPAVGRSYSPWSRMRTGYGAGLF